MVTKYLLVSLFLFTGCVSSSDSITRGASVYQNFCSGSDYALLVEKGVRLSGLASDPSLVIAFKNGVTGSITFFDAVSKTRDYLPGESDEDDYYILIDGRALRNETVYCAYAVGVSERTGNFLILNATRLLLFA